MMLLFTGIPGNPNASTTVDIPDSGTNFTIIVANHSVWEVNIPIQIKLWFYQEIKLVLEIAIEEK